MVMENPALWEPEVQWIANELARCRRRGLLGNTDEQKRQLAMAVAEKLQGCNALAKNAQLIAVKKEVFMAFQEADEQVAAANAGTGPSCGPSLPLRIYCRLQEKKLLVDKSKIPDHGGLGW